jgi:hypothetical protein
MFDTHHHDASPTTPATTRPIDERPNRAGPVARPSHSPTANLPTGTGVDAVNVIQALESAAPPNRRRFASWTAAEPALAGLRRDQLPAALLDRTSSTVDYDHRDSLLAALIRISRHDQHAGALLVTCLLPGLRARITRHGWGLDTDDARSIALTALWHRIATYPLSRRPHRIAMNLLLDTTHDLITTRDRELAWQNNTRLTDRPIPTPEPDRSTPLLWHNAQQAGVLNHREIALIHSTRIHGIPITQIAPLIGMTHDAARKARQRATHKLKAWWTTQAS